MDIDDVWFYGFLNGILFTTTAGINAPMDSDTAAFLHEDDDVVNADVNADDDGVADELIGPLRFHELDNDHDA